MIVHFLQSCECIFQGELLCAELDKRCPESAPHKPYIGFRYAHPLTEDTLDQMEKWDTFINVMINLSIALKGFRIRLQKFSRLFPVSPWAHKKVLRVSS